MMFDDGGNDVFDVNGVFGNRDALDGEDGADTAPFAADTRSRSMPKISSFRELVYALTLTSEVGDNSLTPMI